MDQIHKTPSRRAPKGSFHARTSLASAVGVVVLVSACATAGSPTPSISASPSSAPSTSSSTTTPVFPVTLTDDEGTALTIPAEPQRIVSLSPANTEILFALGAEDRAVGGTDFDDFPPEAADLADVANFNGVLIEQAVDLAPDLILAAGNNFTPAADIERLRSFGFPVLVLYAETVDEVLADIELIGSAVGEREAAEVLTGAMREREADVTAAAEASTDRPRVFYQIGSEPEIFGPAPGSFVSDMVELAGGDPITTADPAVFSISLERLVAQDPEIIIVGDAAYGVCPDQVAARSGWQRMTAVREGAIRPIDDLIVTRPGPRLAEGLAVLAAAINPELELEPSPPPVPYCQ